MPIIKIQKRNNPYVVLDKTFINDSRLSLKSKGLLAYLLSLPSDWEVHIKELTKHFPDGKHAISGALKELRQLGYVIHQRHRDSSGAYTHGNYHVFEIPQTSPQPENQDVGLSPQPDFPVVDNLNEEKPVLENRSLLNNKETKDTFNKKITAAIETPSTTPSSYSVAAVPFEKSKKEAWIGEALTEEQAQLVKRSAEGWLAYQPELDFNGLTQAITQTLLDSQSFSQAGRDFRKKLNTIGKQIREDRWSVPVAVEEKTKQRERNKKIVIECELRELEGERAHLNRMLSTLDKTQHDQACVSLERQLSECDNKIKQLVQTMTQGGQQ
ncbi:MAG: hypothetical protein KDH94_00900 [Coxiellaceae bacterium]|nr:hypothetical protein [Coxiellaceae bacterium]